MTMKANLFRVVLIRPLYGREPNHIGVELYVIAESDKEAIQKAQNDQSLPMIAAKAEIVEDDIGYGRVLGYSASDVEAMRLMPEWLFES